MFAAAIMLHCILADTGCRMMSQPNDSYYDSLYARLDRHFTTGDITQQIVDSMNRYIAAQPAPSPYLRYLQYRRYVRHYYSKGKLDSAADYSDSAARVLEDNGLQSAREHEYKNSISATGDLNFLAGKYDLAILAYNKNRRVIEESKDTCALSNQSYHLGMVTYRQEKYADAAAYFKQYLREVASCSRDSYSYFRIQEVYSNIGLAYTHLRKDDSAIHYFRYALRVIDTEGQRYNSSKFYAHLSVIAKGVILGNLARVYFYNKQYDSAQQLLMASIAINARPGFEVNDGLTAMMSLAELYAQTGKNDSLPRLINNIEIGLDSIHSSDVNIRFNRLKHRYYRSIHNDMAALQSLERYTALKNAADSSLKALKKVDYAQIFREQETQYRIKLMKKDSQRNYLLAGGLLVILIIVGAFIYYNYRKSRRNVTALTELNGQITEQKEQLENAMIQLQDINQQKDRILHVVAHDLRSPAASIMMIADLELDDADDKQKVDSLRMIRAASGSMLNLTSELLEFSGETLNKPKANAVVTDMRDIANVAAGLLRFKAQEKGQHIHLSTPDKPVLVRCHPDKISRVFNNLITNAIKFSPLAGSINITVAERTGNCIIAVADQGIGIASALTESVFQPFTSAQRTGTSGEPSFGLGLSICRQIVEAHNGRIWVESEEGKGSTFFIELPLS